MDLRSGGEENSTEEWNENEEIPHFQGRVT